jgi:hypothetical protein
MIVINVRDYSPTRGLNLNSVQYRVTGVEAVCARCVSTWLDCIYNHRQERLFWGDVAVRVCRDVEDQFTVAIVGKFRSARGIDGTKRDRGCFYGF